MKYFLRAREGLKKHCGHISDHFSDHFSEFLFSSFFFRVSFFLVGISTPQKIFSPPPPPQPPQPNSPKTPSRRLSPPRPLSWETEPPPGIFNENRTPPAAFLAPRTPPSPSHGQKKYPKRPPSFFSMLQNLILRPERPGLRARRLL